MMIKIIHAIIALVCILLALPLARAAVYSPTPMPASPPAALPPDQDSRMLRKQNSNENRAQRMLERLQTNPSLTNRLSPEMRDLRGQNRKINRQRALEELQNKKIENNQSP